MAARQYLSQIGIENRRVQAITLETPAQVEGTTAAQDSADERHIEVNAGGNMRQAEALVVDDITQQQVVEVTPVAGHVDDLVITGNLVQTVDVPQFNTVVYPVPHPAEKPLHDPDGWIGNVGCNFLGVLAGLLRCPFTLGATVAGLGIDGSTYTGVVHHDIDECAAV
jgi:hypothetical protein